MTDDISGKGDPLVTLRLLWGKTAAATRGPKAKHSLADIVAAAIRITDRDGLPGLTTRRVAEELGISPMSFYTYVPGKNELLDLMLDAVLAEIVRPRGATWRDKLADVAQQNWDLVLRHPWILQVATHRAVLGPHTFAKYDFELSAVDGIGLTELEMDRVLTLVLDYTSGAVRGAARERWVKERTGMTDHQWWYTVAPHLEEIFTPEYSKYPTATRVGPIVGETYGAHDPTGSFTFGLARLLDGLEPFISARAPKPPRKRASRGRRTPKR
jgi:AcrR family transcriptional regulator